MAECRSCGAEIKFIKTTRGKWMPVDPEQIQAKDCELNNVIVKEDGTVITVTPYTSDDTVGYVSHFATCPNAEEHKK